MNPLPNPQVAAVHQTLAGERLACQVQFPLTGDPDCDLIQGILATVKAIDISSLRAVAVLRYLVDRFGQEADSLKQPGQQPWDYHSIREVVRQALDEHIKESTLRTQPWYGSITSGGSVGQLASSAGMGLGQVLTQINPKP